MNLLGDNRYTTPGEYAAMVNGQSQALRDRVYEANRAKFEAFDKARNPAITAEQVRAQWMSEHPLGWVEHKLAWSPSGELGKWAIGNPAIVKIDGTLFVHGGISAEYAKASMDDVNRRVAAGMQAADDSATSVLSDPLGPLWYRGLVARDGDAQAERAAMKPPPPLARRRAGARYCPCFLWCASPGRCAHAEHQGHPDRLWRPAGRRRYGQFALLWRTAQLARDHR